MRSITVTEPAKRFHLGVLTIFLSCVVLARLGGHAVAVRASAIPSGAIVLEDFEKHGTANFPKNWWSGSSGAEQVYRIEAESRYRFLYARAENRGGPIGIEYFFNPKKLRHLQWRWRLRTLPTGADERAAEKHDAAAQVYIMYDNQYWPRIVKFIWSASRRAFH